MKETIVMLGAAAALLSQHAAAAPPRTHHGIVIDAPFAYIKEAFAVGPDDAALVPVINEARHAIAGFLKELATYQVVPGRTDPWHFVVPGAEKTLTPPPRLSNGSPLRYAIARVDGWRLRGNELEFNVEWGDAANPDNRFTDSYVFTKVEGRWLYAAPGGTRAHPWTRKH